jgi:hypothetical protein
MCCKVASGAIDKHNSIVNAIYINMKKAKITCNVEAKNPMNNASQRPGDIYMPEFDGFGDAFFDVSVMRIARQLEGSEIRYEAIYDG